jgi:hypothetical protein
MNGPTPRRGQSTDEARQVIPGSEAVADEQEFQRLLALFRLCHFALSRDEQAVNVTVESQIAECGFPGQGRDVQPRPL